MDHTVLVHPQAEKIFQYYNSPSIAAGYARQEYITPCEQLLFSTYIEPGVAILDIGVGGGRTSPYLAKSASRYVGIDYAPEMVRLCRRKYPQWEYCEGSAIDLSCFQDKSFDVIVMSYNVLDDLVPDASRWRCLQECHRVLGNNGLLIFSSHNPRALITRPESSKSRQRNPAHLTERILMLLRLLVDNAAIYFTLVRSTLHRVIRYGLRSPFWRGEGYMPDEEKLMTHFWTPKNAIAELSRYGFQFVALQGDDYPKRSYQLITDWYYYIFKKVLIYN
jgi:ubiquinone/menaquinone biosynthesis C-methylase UbiE